MRRLEPAARADGGRVDPADADGPPDDRHRPGAAVREHHGHDRVPDRPRHGHEHVRAPGGDGPRDRLLRAPPDHARRRRDPVDRGVGADADRAAVHPGGLRSADGDRARADARDRRRRERRREVRDQRRAVGDLRRDAAARRDARGPRPVVGGGDLDQGGPRRGQDGRRADGPRRVRDRRVRVQHRPRVPVPADADAHHRPRLRGLQQDVRDRPSRRAVGVQPRRAAVAVLRARARARRRLLRDRRLGAAALVRVERAAARGVRRPDQPPRGRVGVALVVADHQRRAPGDARPLRR